jgi:hypothetical protein
MGVQMSSKRIVCIGISGGQSDFRAGVYAPQWIDGSLVVHDGKVTCCLERFGGVRLSLKDAMRDALAQEDKNTMFVQECNFNHNAISELPPVKYFELSVLRDHGIVPPVPFRRTCCD